MLWTFSGKALISGKVQIGALIAAQGGIDVVSAGTVQEIADAVGYVTYSLGVALFVNDVISGYDAYRASF